MSQDYPFYEELKKRGSRGAKYWRVGDWAYYIGLLGSGLSFIVALKWTTLFWATGVFVVVFLLGTYLKAISYSIGRQEGIEPNDY